MKGILVEILLLNAPVLPYEEYLSGLKFQRDNKSISTSMFVGLLFTFLSAFGNSNCII